MLQKPRYKMECENCKVKGEETIIEGTDKDMVESTFRIHTLEHEKSRTKEVQER